MEEKICEFVKKEDLAERAKSVIRRYEERRKSIEKKMEAIDKKAVLTEEEIDRSKELTFNHMNNRNELGAVIEAIVLMDIMESEEVAEYLASLEDEADNGGKDA